MSKICIICPECGQPLSFEEVAGYEKMVVKCPKCSFRARASAFKRAREVNKSVPDDSSTQIIFNKPTSLGSKGQIRVLASGLTFGLNIGTNVIGRDTENGNADIKIPNDPYMSRRHLIIEVIKNEWGFEHRLVEINSTNVIFLNGNPVNRGDILRIKFGDIMTLGNTDIRLEEDGPK